ncbi:hypothetical protein [Spirosoma litoris]
MIKIGKSIKELDTLAEIFYKEVVSKLDLPTLIEQKINNAIHNHLVDEEIFYREIKAHLKDIIVSKPADLENLSNLLYPLYLALETFRVNIFPDPRTRKQVREAKRILKDEIFSLFNYNFFTTDNEGKWAYDHSLRMELNVCPYCNTQYTFTIKTSKGKTRPQYDHFFKKSKHPYFALSFYNLIPSCYVCNANLKGQKEFRPSTHIHPFIEGTEDTIHFKTNISKVDFLLGKKNFDITLQTIVTANTGKAARTNKSLSVFHIEEQYAFHKAYAGEIIYKAYLYTDTKIQELIEQFHKANGEKVFSSKEEIIEMLFGNHLREEKLHKRVLSKLTKNIANELGIKV